MTKIDLVDFTLLASMCYGEITMKELEECNHAIPHNQRISDIPARVHRLSKLGLCSYVTSISHYHRGKKAWATTPEGMEVIRRFEDADTNAFDFIYKYQK